MDRSSAYVSAQVTTGPDGLPPTSTPVSLPPSIPTPDPPVSTPSTPIESITTDPYSITTTPSSPPSSTTTLPPGTPTTPSSVTTTTSSLTTSLKPVMTSSAIPIVTVSSSGKAVYTYTSTSYSSYQTTVPTVVPVNNHSQSTSSNTGAIVGGVVGGVAGVALIAFAIFFLIRRNKHKKNVYKDNNDDINRIDPVNPHPYTDYNSYGSPTMVASDNNSVGRPLSMTATPRPFVQAYNPAMDHNQMGQQYVGYDGTHSVPMDPSQKHYIDPSDPTYQQYYHDYQPNAPGQQYGTSYSNYSHDSYYAQAEPMIPNTGAGASNNATGDPIKPDEIDYPRHRHVPNEID